MYKVLLKKNIVVEELALCQKDENNNKAHANQYNKYGFIPFSFNIQANENTANKQLKTLQLVQQKANQLNDLFLFFSL